MDTATKMKENLKKLQQLLHLADYSLLGLEVRRDLCGLVRFQRVPAEPVLSGFVERRGVLCRSLMNQGNPPPYPGPGPTAPYPPYPSQPMGPGFYPPGPPGGPYPPPQGGYPYQGYPQYGWQGGPQEPPKTTVYVVEDQRRDDLGTSTCLTACWTALCCCCLWDMLT
ncbi:hypothetical protein CapIbe_007030 [Capra ibex]